MIKNERQYRITKAQSDKFAHALAQAEQESGKNGQIHPLLKKAQEDALRSQLTDLRLQLEEYEALKSGKRAVLALNSFEELPKALIQARIASGLSQKELAQRLGVKEQQLQRYEATEYASVSLTRAMEVARVLGIKMREDVLLPSAQTSPALLIKRLEQIGLNRDFVLKRLLPPSFSACLQERKAEEKEQANALTLQASALIGRVFGWNPTALLGSTPLQVNMAAVEAARFKVTAGTDENRISAYTVYAHFLALLLLEAAEELPKRPIPTEAHELRKAVLSTYGSITFESALRYVWSLGIPVLPLNDPGAFHGACWRVDGRNVIVLKQKTQSTARWLFDLLHELKHAGQEPEHDQLVIIESSDDARDRKESREEQMASQFAGDVTLAGRSKELAELCVNAAKSSVERLKAAVPRVAKKENISVDALANYMAFRLSLQDINWWGAATNLQEKDVDPWQIARDILLETISFEQLNEIDRNILMQALSD